MHLPTWAATTGALAVMWVEEILAAVVISVVAAGMFDSGIGFSCSITER